MNVVNTPVSIVRAGGAWPAQTAIAVPLGVGLASLHARSSGGVAYNGQTVTSKWQGSPDGLNWEDIADSSQAFTADTAASAVTYQGGSDKLVDLTPYAFVRPSVSESGGTTNGLTITAGVYAVYDSE